MCQEEGEELGLGSGLFSSYWHLMSLGHRTSTSKTMYTYTIRGDRVTYSSLQHHPQEVLLSFVPGGSRRQKLCTQGTTLASTFSCAQHTNTCYQALAEGHRRGSGRWHSYNTQGVTPHGNGLPNQSKASTGTQRAGGLQGETSKAHRMCLP